MDSYNMCLEIIVFDDCRACCIVIVQAKFEAICPRQRPHNAARLRLKHRQPSNEDLSHSWAEGNANDFRCKAVVNPILLIVL